MAIWQFYGKDEETYQLKAAYLALIKLINARYENSLKHRFKIIHHNFLNYFCNNSIAYICHHKKWRKKSDHMRKEGGWVWKK